MERSSRSMLVSDLMRGFLKCRIREFYKDRALNVILVKIVNGFSDTRLRSLLHFPTSLIEVPTTSLQLLLSRNSQEIII